MSTRTRRQTGAGLQLASSLGGFEVGALAAGDTSVPEKRQQFSDDDLQKAYQAQQQADEEDEIGEHDWNVVGSLIKSINQDEENEGRPEEPQKSS